MFTWQGFRGGCGARGGLWGGRAGGGPEGDGAGRPSEGGGGGRRWGVFIEGKVVDDVVSHQSAATECTPVHHTDGERRVEELVLW